MKRIKSYKLFESNSNNMNLLIEGLLTYSKNFIQRLDNIKDSSKIAEILLNMIGKEYDDKNLKQNFIDITNKKDLVTYLSQKKYNELISKDKIKNTEDAFNVKQRDDVKIGRLVSKILELEGVKVKDADISKFIDLFKSESNDGNESMRLVSGEEISYWYKSENMLEPEETGTLGHSCMVDAEDYEESIFDLYCLNKGIKLLILTKNINGTEKLIGRAIIWELSDSPVGKINFMDRIYTYEQSDENKFIKYADSNNWLRKSENSSTDESRFGFIQNGKKIEGIIKFKNNVITLHAAPFLDTLVFSDKKFTELSNVGYIDGWVLDDTTGDISPCIHCDGEGKVECNYCFDGKRECSHCQGEGCEFCDETGEVECNKCKGKEYIVCVECVGLYDQHKNKTS